MGMSTPAYPPNYGITRIDQPHKKNHGYYVRIRHRGTCHSKFFSDRSNGGKREALRLARDHRDSLLAKLPGKVPVAKRKRVPQCAEPGITHVRSKQRDTVGKVKHYDYWQASWMDENGKRRTAKFAISRYGDDRAQQMAIKARRKALQEVKKDKAAAA